MAGRATAPGAGGRGFAARLDAFDWEDAAGRLDASGFTVLPGLLPESECAGIAAAYDDEGAFRSRIDMRRHGFGEGEYKYFAYPLPAPVADLRTALYARLAPVANAWMERLGSEVRYPDAHRAFVARCHAAGQERPTPLVLRYRAGGYNRLHQDLYGELSFPLQAAVLLDRPGEDFEGGEFVLTEQKPRSQSRAHVVPLARGDAVVFAVDVRPARGTRGYHRLRMRHGVSEIRAGSRHTLGIIFHDAR